MLLLGIVDLTYVAVSSYRSSLCWFLSALGLSQVASWFLAGSRSTSALSLPGTLSPLGVILISPCFSYRALLSNSSSWPISETSPPRPYFWSALLSVHAYVRSPVSLAWFALAESVFRRFSHMAADSGWRWWTLSDRSLGLSFSLVCLTGRTGGVTFFVAPCGH